MPQRIFDSGQSFADARVIHHPPIFERNIEIHSHKNSVVVQRQIANGEFRHINPYQENLMGAQFAALPPWAPLHLQTFASDEINQVANAGGVSPLVVVPGDHLYQIPDDHGRERIDNRRTRVTAEIGRDQFVLFKS